MGTGKHWYASKTIWANVVALIAAVAMSAGLDLGLDPETQATIVAGILAIVNVVLRLITREPVKLGKGGGRPPSAAAVVLLPLALLLSGCGALQQIGESLTPEHPPDTVAEAVGYLEADIAALARATTRASRAGSITLDEAVDIRAGIADLERLADESTRLLALGEVTDAETTLGRAERVLALLQRELREAQSDE
jgi:hypothetical protein